MKSAPKRNIFTNYLLILLTDELDAGKPTLTPRVH